MASNEPAGKRISGQNVVTLREKIARIRAVEARLRRWAIVYSAAALVGVLIGLVIALKIGAPKTEVRA